MFSSRFMLFPTFKKKWCKKISGGGGGGVLNLKKKIKKKHFLFISFRVIMLFSTLNLFLILKSAPSLGGYG